MTLNGHPVMLERDFQESRLLEHTENQSFMVAKKKLLRTRG